MRFARLRDNLRQRLEEADRGDRGWWLLTRVHVSAARLQAIAEYLNDAGAASELIFADTHYARLAQVLGIGTTDPRQTINRHYLLAMETPLRLLTKVDPRSWDAIRLNPVGVRLAEDDDTPRVFEELLSDLRFCQEPWYAASRVAEYDGFNVQPYRAALAIMRENGGKIDIDEFDLFVSRVRNNREIASASRCVGAFRNLNEARQAALRLEVEERIPEGAGKDPRKPYNNWRDMARHTFSLFSLGKSAQRVGNELWLSESLTESLPPRRRGGRASPPAPARSRVRTLLRMPTSVAPEDLLTPPEPPVQNSGAEAELLVGKILSSNGWEVVYYNKRRGYGFDLWAKKNDRAFVVEVKSFAEAAGAVSLTELEHQAAQRHGEQYLLVIVEDAASEAPQIHVVQHPTEAITFTARRADHYTAARSVWEIATRAAHARRGPL